VDAGIGSRLRLGAIGAVGVLLAGLAGAQPTPQAPPGPPPASAELPPPPSLGPVVAPPPQEASVSDAASEDVEAAPRAKPAEPVGPPRPDRSPTAILRVLDKVTAETLRFEAPVGRRIRYKSLVFEVRACETWSPHAAAPRPSAYVVIDADLGRLAEGEMDAKPVFKGWMFAQAPGVHALEHPVFDAWLESCTTATVPG
jgi:hypothetical protein